MAVELDLCDAMLAAIRADALAGGYARPVNVQSEPFPSADLEEFFRDSNVNVLIVPNSSVGTPSDLAGGDEETLGTNVIVTAKLVERTLAELRVLLTLTRAVWSTIENDLDSNAWGFDRREANPGYDHDAARDRGQFFSECVFFHKVYRDEDAA